MTDISGRGRNVIPPPSGGQRNDGQERMSSDGTDTGNQFEEDNINAADSSDDEPVFTRHVIIENSTSTPQNSGTTSDNGLLATLLRGNGLLTAEEMMTAWNLVQQQQQHPQHNDDNYGDNGRINAAGKRALSYRVAKQLQKKHVNTCIQGFVKTFIFRKCKFITSKAYYNKVMAVVIESEKPADPPKFVRLYKMCALGSLNSKRSSCQQAASDFVKPYSTRQSNMEAKSTHHPIPLTCSASFANLKPLKKKRRSSGSQIHCWNACVGK